MEIPSMTILGRTVLNEKYWQVINIIHKFFYTNVCINYRSKCGQLNRNKNIICETRSFYVLLAFLLITIALLIAVSISWYLIKYKAKQKDNDVTNSKLKKVLCLIIYF